MGILKGIFDFAAALLDTTASRIDKMDDDEIKRKYPDKSIHDVRRAADAAHMLHDKRVNQKDKED